jgi:hypothetical protein
LAELFLPAYNGVHSTTYVNPPLPATPAVDFTWKSPAVGVPPLEVQHTVGAVDQVGDRIRPLATARLSRAVQEWVKRELPQGYGVHLSVPNAWGPSVKFADLLGEITTGLHRIAHALPLPGAGSFRVPVGGEESTSNCSDLRVEVVRHGQPVGSLAFAHGESFMPVAVPRVREAIDRKQADLHGRTSNMVLLVHFDVDGYDADDLSEVRREAGKGTVLFSEVWGVSLWTPGERADRLWP